MTDSTQWSRTRQSFSCPQDLWDTCKLAWANALDDYPAWTDWLEAAIADGTAATRARAGGALRTAPARIPPGRREPAPAGAPTRARRSFTCRPDIWTDARDAWWTEREQHPQLSDWICAALAAKAAAHTTESSHRTPPP